MKRITIVVGILAMLTLSYTLYKSVSVIHKLNNCRNTYEYLLNDGTKGTNNKCFEKNGKSICRIDNRNIKVLKIERLEVCR